MTARASTRTLPAAGGGIIRRTVLPGGLRIVTETMPGVRSASVGIWVGVGSRDEQPSVAGSSHFLEHLLFKGTRDRSGLGHRAGHGRGRRRVQRVHREGAHLLLRHRARPGTAAGHRDHRRRGAERDDRRERRRHRTHRRAGGDPDARRRPVGSGARRVRAVAVRRHPAGPADPGHRGFDQPVEPDPDPRLLLPPVQAERDGGLGGRQHRARRGGFAGPQGVRRPAGRRRPKPRCVRTGGSTPARCSRSG